MGEWPAARQMLFIALTFYLGAIVCAKPTERCPRGCTSKGIAQIGLCGLALGAALQCKYAMALTTLAWLGLQNIVYLAQLLGLHRSFRPVLLEAAARGVLLLGLPLLLHVLMFALHLQLLSLSGNGDNYMSVPFQATLEGSRYQGVPPADRPGFASKLAEHAVAQFWYNRNMAVLFPRGSHNFDTAWFTWPLAWRGIYFSLVRDWTAVANAPYEKHVLGYFLHPNPFITLFTTALAASTAIALLVAAAAFVVARRRGVGAWLVSELEPGGIGSLLLAYLLHWLPYATQTRQTFLLYYLPAYYFAILLAARVWHLAVCRSLPRPVPAMLTIAVCVATGAVTWKTFAIAYGSPVHVMEWNEMLRLASTECWFKSVCWANVT